MSRVRPHLTYANVMVTILAFIVLGGVAVAATNLPKGSVGTNQLKGNAVTQRKIHKNAVTQGKIRSNSVTGAKVKNGSLTGADVVASTLGTVPYAEKAGEAVNATTAQSATTAKSATTAASADTAASAQTAADAHELGGEPPSAFAPSSRFFYVTVDPASEPAEELFSLPGGIRLTTDGDSDKKFELVAENTGADTWSISSPSLVEEEELPSSGGSATFTLSPELTAVVVLQDRDKPQKAVALQCGLTLFPPRLTCFATLSPALSP